MKRRGFIAGLTVALLSTTAHATQFTTWPFLGTGGTATRTQPDRIVDMVNAKEFGAKGDGTTDDTVAIQAAIDYAFAHAKQAIFLPTGAYKTSSALFLDSPLNLRVSLTGPPATSAFSMALVGERSGGTNHESFGTRIKPTSNSFVALWVGPGRGMSVSDILISPPASASRAAAPTTGCGIAIAAYGSRATLTQCAVENYYRGICPGFNQDNLADANTLIKCWVNNCYIGAHFKNSQNDINSLYDCIFQDCKTHVLSDVGRPVQIWGGNYSTSSALHASFTISSTSPLTSFSDNYAGINGFTNYTFTTTLTSPDTPMASGDYDAFVIKTTSFGVVPLLLTAYNSGTGVATLKFAEWWLLGNYGQVQTISSLTDIDAELQAATTLYCCEWIQIFNGSAINAKGVHIENPTALTSMIVDATGSIGGLTSVVEDVFLNWDPGQTGNKGAGATQGIFYCQQVFPFIQQGPGTARLTVRNVTSSQTSGSEPILIANLNGARMIFEGNDFYAPNIQVVYNGTNINSGNWPIWQSVAHGAGEWDQTPFLPHTGNFAAQWRSTGNGRSKFLGYRPDPASVSRLLPAQITTLSGVLPTIGTYPLMNGDAIYSISEFNAGAPTHLFAKNASKFYSYGQNITSNSWSYKGASTVVTMADTSLMFAGLTINLDNGSGSLPYVVTGVYPALGYVTVCAISSDSNAYYLAGLKTTTFSGTTIAQDAFSITQF